MSNKKFLVFGGFVCSKHDKQWHFIDAIQVAKLYRIPLCLCLFASMGFKHEHNLIELHADASGKYELPKQ